MLNKVILYGRLTKDPELRATTSGIQVCRFTIAVDRQYSKGEEKKTDFIECVAWRSTAEFLSRYFQKGTALIAEGSLQNNNYEKDGVKHYSYTVNVSQVYFAESKKASNDSSVTGADSNEADSFAEEILGDGELPF